MKKLQVLTVVATLIGSAALTEAATQLNLRVEGDAGEGWADSINVQAGQSVDYRVLGVLSNSDQNEGLALFGFDVSYSCGDLTTQMAVSTESCMENFEIPLGITNPAGFGGTTNVPEHLGDLVQVGGAVNTILNDAGNAPYPTGAVCLGLGWTEVVLATGSLTIPGDAQDQDQCTIDLSAVFANVIKVGEVSDGTFFSVEPADPGTPTSLTMTVVELRAALTSSAPQCDESLWRTQNNFVLITFNLPITAPAPGEVLIQEIMDGGVAGPDLSANFLFTVEGAGNDVLRITEDGDSPLIHRRWYRFANTGGWAEAFNFERDYVVQMGDCDNNGLVVGADFSCVNTEITCFSCPDRRADIDGNNLIVGADASLVNSFIPSFPVAKPTGHSCSP